MKTQTRGSSPIDALIQPFRIFAEYKLSGAIVLLTATTAALIWANSPWAASYYRLLASPLTVGFGTFALAKPLLLWINDGLMAIFFFVVGLEIKREVLSGELASRRKATLPIAAALGGMVVPAGLYLLLNARGPGAPGWGIPMATDIAFALGVLALLGSRVPVSLKIFLTALAIVDDLGAIAVIAIFYTDSISLGALAIAGAAFALAVLANRLGVRSSLGYFLLGLVVWLGFLKSGVHATLAAVLMAMTIPATTAMEPAELSDRVRALLGKITGSSAADQAQGGASSAHDDHGPQQALDEIALLVGDASTPVQRLEHALNPLVTFLVLPIFALANSGLALSGASVGPVLGDPIALGVVLGLVVGKPLGITFASWLAVRFGLADLPAGVAWKQLAGVAILGGIGFTMALFINGLAFAPDQQGPGKLAILAASAACAVAGTLVLSRVLPPAPTSS